MTPAAFALPLLTLGLLVASPRTQVHYHPDGRPWKQHAARGPDAEVPGWYYNLDRFTGKIDEEREEFQSVNNDGGRMVNHPTVFRRIKCDEHDDAPKASVEVKPPPIFPENSTDCGCSLAVGR